MIAFPRIMITIAGCALLVILVLAGRDLFPHHAKVAQGIGACLGLAINVVLQIGLWSKPAAS